MSRFRILIAPEGVLTDGAGFDPDALTYKTTVPILRSGEPVGAIANIGRETIDGVVWLTSDTVVFDGEYDGPANVVADVGADVERFDMSPESHGRWVESGELRAVVLSDTPGFDGATIELVDDTDDVAGLVAEAEAVLAAADTGGPAAWSGVLAVEGEPTGDGRMLEADSIYWDFDLFPLPLKFDRDEGDHSAAIVGEITRVWRDNNQIMGEGFLHTDSADPETVGLVARTVELLEAAGGAIPGVSVELDSEEVDVRVDKASWDQHQAEMEAWLDDEVPEPEDPEVVDGRVVVDDWLYVTTGARLRGAAIVDNAAFADARIEIVASGGTVPHIWLTGLVAHGAPDERMFDLPPSEWFRMVEPDETDPRVVWVNTEGVPVEAGAPDARPWGVPLTIDNGQVYGHLASWQDCHTAYTDRCLTPPRSPSGYAWFHTGATRTQDGPVPTGRITVDTGHANPRASAASAVGHYDQTGHAVADVAAVDGVMGPWLSGWVRPWATDQQKHELSANPPSGDWRPRGGSTELVGVLAVNVPGFPLPRTVATFRRDKLVSLVASGFAPIAPINPLADPLASRVARLEARLEADAALAALGAV